LILPENDVCRFVGVLPLKDRPRNDTKIKLSEVPLFNYFYDLHNAEGGESSNTTEAMNTIDCNKVIVDGGTDAIHDVLKQMSSPNPCKFSYEEIIEAVESNKTGFPLSRLGKIDFNNMNMVKINPDANSGFLSKLVAGRTRRESFGFTYLAAKSMLKMIRKHDLPTYDL
jgi:hypothetical protein